MSNKKILWACLMTCLFFSSALRAKILKDEKTITNISEYSFTEVCKSLTERESALIDFSNISELNCMGQKVDVNKFCDEKEAGNPYYIRAQNDQKKKVVKCISSKKVILKY